MKFQYNQSDLSFNIFTKLDQNQNYSKRDISRISGTDTHTHTDRQTHTHTHRNTDKVCRSHSPQTVTIKAQTSLYNYIDKAQKVYLLQKQKA